MRSEDLWEQEDLWIGIPEEFRGAEMSQTLRDMLKPPYPRSLALVGPPGTGKTRSLWAMLHSMRVAATRDRIGTEIRREHIQTDDYSSRLETTLEAIKWQLGKIDRMQIITEVGDIRPQRYERKELGEWCRTDKWLAVDDIGAIEPNEWVREAIYHLANERRAHNRVTVWTSNLSPQKIRDTFGAAIASRILGGTVIEVAGEDRRVK